jgi:hypothetical protein
LIDGIGDDAGRIVDRGGQNLRLELNAVHLQRKIQLRRRHHFDAIFAVVARIDQLLDRREIDCIIAQIEGAGVALLILQLKVAGSKPLIVVLCLIRSALDTM